MGCCRDSRKGVGQPESLIDLDGCEGGEVDADSAAAFAQQLLADKVRRSAQQSATVSTADRPDPSQRAGTDSIRLSNGAASLDEPHVSMALRQPRGPQEAQTAGSRGNSSPKMADSLGVGSICDLAEYIVGDSEEDDDLTQPDRDEDRWLLSGNKATAVADSPLLPLHCSQRRHGSSHAAHDKENVLWEGLPVHHAAERMSGQRAEQQPVARGQQAQQPGSAKAPYSSSRPDDSAGQGQPASQLGRKQLRRLYAAGSKQAHGQASDAAYCLRLGEDVDLRDSCLFECNGAEDAIRSTELQERAKRDAFRQQVGRRIEGGGSDEAFVSLSASEEDHTAGGSLSGDAEQELGTHSSGNGYVRDSWPEDVSGQRTQHDTVQAAVSTGSAQHTIDSWDSRLPQSSAFSRQKRSVSPETSQHRPCSQVCLTTAWRPDTRSSN